MRCTSCKERVSSHGSYEKELNWNKLQGAQFVISINGSSDVSLGVSIITGTEYL